MNNIQQYNGEMQTMPSHQSVQQGSTVNAGTALTEQSRAVAEALGKLQVAKQFPRDENVAYSKIMAACSRHAFASTALYSYPKGGQQVSGPSIRMAEMLIRAWGNCEAGLKELSQRDGESEMMAYTWDYETNTMFVKNFAVKHERKARGKTTKLSDPRDIYELTANNGSRRQRATMLAAIPDYIVEDAVNAVKQTLAGNSGEPVTDRVRKMVAAFGKFGVTPDMIAKYVGFEVDLIDSETLVDLTGVYNSIKSGDFKASQYFSDLSKNENKPATEAEKNLPDVPQQPANKKDI
jgi:hypothetical protein